MQKSSMPFLANAFSQSVFLNIYFKSTRIIFGNPRVQQIQSISQEFKIGAVAAGFIFYLNFIYPQHLRPSNRRRQAGTFFALESPIKVETDRRDIFSSLLLLFHPTVSSQRNEGKNLLQNTLLILLCCPYSCLRVNLH